MGGGERLAVNLSNQLSEMGHDVTLCMMEDAERDPARSVLRPLLSPGVRFHSFGLTRRWSPREMWRVSKWLLDQRPDVIHYHMTGYWYLLPLLLRGGVGRPIVVETLHSMPDTCLVRPWELYTNRLLYSSGRVFPVTLSRGAADMFGKMYPRARQAIIPNGVPPVAPSPRFEEVRLELESLRGKEGKILLHVGRHHPAKNHQRLVEAFEEVRRRGVDAEMVVLGRGFDTAAAGDLHRLAGEHMHFLGQKDNAGDYMLLSDLYCMSSDYEGSPLTVAEAMSAGLPCVCTPIAAVAGMVEEGATGFVAAGMTAADYADALERGLATPLPSAAIRAAWADRFSLARCAQAYLSLYDSLGRNMRHSD